MTNEKLSWANLKTAKSDMDLPLFAREDDNYIYVYLPWAGGNFTSYLKKGSADATDYTNNFKADANQPNWQRTDTTPGRVWVAHLKVPTITATSKFILIKKDGQDYRSPDGILRLTKVKCRLIKSDSNDVWQVNYGVCVSQDGAEGTVKWLHHLFDYVGNDEIIVGSKPLGVMDLTVESGDLKFITTKHQQTDAAWKTGGALKSASTAPMSGTPTYSVDVGDLVVELELKSGSGNLNKNSFIMSYEVR